MCFGCSKEPSHRDGSFEYPQHMFWLRKKIQLRTIIWGPGQDFCRLLSHPLMFLDILYCKQYGPNSDFIVFASIINEPVHVISNNVAFWHV